jgi:PAS domain S-box-containing protein
VEHSFVSVAELSALPIVLLNADFNIYWCNSAFCDFSGYSAAILYARPLGDFTASKEPLNEQLKLLIEGQLSALQLEKPFFARMASSEMP